MQPNFLFDFKEDYLLENNRVVVRPLQLSDIGYLAPFVLSEPTIWTYSLSAIKSYSDIESYIKKAIDERHQQKAYPFIVFDKQLNKYMGSTRLYDMEIAFGTTLLGYTWYGKQSWGTGLNLNCKYLLLNFAFEQMNLKRVEFRADNNNKRSIASMQKIGCTVEGILRNHLPMPDGSRRDTVVLSILQEEWIQDKKNKLLSLIGL